MRCRIADVVAIVLAFASGVGAESWAPVVARQRRTETRVENDGSETVLKETSGVFLRTSSGSVLMTEGPVVSGTEQAPTKGTLIDRGSGRRYDLVYSSKIAILRGQVGSDRPPSTPEYLAEARMRAVGEKLINGISCLGYPIIDARNRKVIGTGWRSHQLDLQVRTETEVSHQGYKIKTVYELYDIRVGVEPESGAVGIPSGFQVASDTKKLPGIAAVP